MVAEDCSLDPDFRVELLVNLGCCNWDAYAQYTWLNPRFYNEITLSLPDGVLITSILETPLQNDPETLDLARVDWISSLNVLDFGLGRTFTVNCCFDIRPHLGFKATWQDIRHELAANTDSGVRLDVENKIHFNGIGHSYTDRV